MTNLRDVQGRSWAIAGLWLLAAVGTVLTIARKISAAPAWGQDWRLGPAELLDYRDIVVVPGRFLWAGGNPYDPDTYLPAHPWAQEFDPYSPAWLLISMTLGPLPIRVGGAIFLGLVAGLLAYFCWVCARLAVPRWADLVAPALMVWCLVWYPTRVMGSSFIVVFGCLLLFSNLRADKGERKFWRDPAVWGLALALLKPQFGAFLLALLLAVGLWRLVLKALLLELLLALVPLIACIISAGGFLPFLRSVIRDIQHASSSESPTGLANANMARIDIPAMWVRVTGQESSVATWVALSLFLAVVGLSVVRRPLAHAMAGRWLPFIVAAPVHINYDMVIALPCLAFAIFQWRTTRRVLEAVCVVALAVVTLHLHRIWQFVGVSRTTGDLVDLLMLLTAGVTATIRDLRRGSYGPAAG